MTALVMMLHGVGSNGQDLAGLAPHLAGSLPQGTRFLSPDGPERFHAGGAGRQWFSIQGVTEANRPARVVAARAALDAMIDRAQAESGASRVILLGFSQGAIMALDALARGKVAEVVAFAGRLAFDGTPSPQEGARALLVGGTGDQVMPHELSREAGARLNAAGAAARVVILPGVPHTITREGLEAAQDFLAAG